MPATTGLRQRSRTLIAAAAVPLALAALADDVRVRRRLDAARRDPLTGLHGRDVLTAHTDRLLHTARRDAVHVLVLDGNGLKAVNDSYGHAAGDAVIRAYGQRLSRWTAGHRDALAARLGGDEFGITAVLHTRTAAQDVAALREQLQAPLHLDGGGRALTPSVSVGIARAADLPGETASRLLRGADAAMYEVKIGRQAFPYRATHADAYADTINGRRTGRPGTHLPAT